MQQKIKSVSHWFYNKENIKYEVGKDNVTKIRYANMGEINNYRIFYQVFKYGNTHYADIHNYSEVIYFDEKKCNCTEERGVNIFLDRTECCKCGINLKYKIIIKDIKENRDEKS